MKLCDHCKMPLDLHMGFDHKARRCLLAFDAIGLSLKFGADLARAVIREAKAWYAREHPGQDEE